MKLKSKGIINLDINGEIYDYKLYQSLNSLAKTGSQRKSAKELNISHTVFNRRLLKAEDKLGVKITQKQGNGTLLTPEGEALLEEYKKYLIQIDKTSEINICGGHISTGLLESIDTTFNTNIYSSNDEDAFKLAKRGVVDLLTLDDPLIAFERDLNMINVQGSAQRLAWNTLEHYDINYKIKSNVNSQFDAFKLVRNSENLYSFLNASYFKGNDILKFDTRHVISLIKVNDEKEELDQFIEYLLTDGQTAIKNQGFIPID